MKRTLTAIAITLALTIPAQAAETVFMGFPVKRITAYGNGAEEHTLSAADAREHKVVITREGGNYFWASRGNVPVVRTVTGIFTVYTATTGAGYVRIISSDLFKDEKYRYVEHLTHMLGSLNYFGE